MDGNTSTVYSRSYLLAVHFHVFFFSPVDDPSTKVFPAEHTVITASAWFGNSQTLTAYAFHDGVELKLFCDKIDLPICVTFY